ncbi:hypothetical protein BDV93DRAFT_523045 [Ceratobasidium sp. AG-I]|nr:hypothetical protein BDV93DRAFT_523045 [Ceratobasidium sp. AG-I]
MILQRTEFPHGDPPRSPRKPTQPDSSRPRLGHRRPNTSLHQVESVYSDSSDEFPSNSPQLETLRQDPSVLSLVSVMDSHGFIPSDIFTNSPATPCPPPRSRIQHSHPFSKSTPELAVRTPLRTRVTSTKSNPFNFRINAVPETHPARPKSEFHLPSFPLHIFPSQNRCATPESHSFSSLQGEQGSFSIPGDSTKKPLFSTHKSLTKASDAFRFLEDRYDKDLPPTPVEHNPRGPSVNDAVGGSSSASNPTATLRVPHSPFVHERGGETFPLSNATYNSPTRVEPVCFSLAGVGPSASPGSHISHSRAISPLGSPLPVLTRIRPYSSSFSRARHATNHTPSSSEETTAPSPSRSLSESSRYSPPSAEISPRTPMTSDLIQGFPTQTRARPLAIVVSPSQVSAYEELQEKKVSFGHPSHRLADFADRGVIRVTRPLRATSGALDAQNYDCHVPTQSVYMQSPTHEDRHTRTTRPPRRIRIPAEEVRAGLGISFDFNSGDDRVVADSVGDRLDEHQRDITPGRPTVVLVPSGRQFDRGEDPASASASASVNLELECERHGPRFAPGLDPQFPLESETHSSVSHASSFYTAREDFVEPEFSHCARFGNRFGHGHARNGTSGTSSVALDFSPRVNLDFDQSVTLAATAVPSLQVSSSPQSRNLHHGTQTAQQRIGLGVGMSLGSRAWPSTSSLVSDNSSRDEYSRFASITRHPAHTHWSQFVPPTPSPERL